MCGLEATRKKLRSRRAGAAALLLCLWLVPGLPLWADNWPAWRGPQGTSVCLEPRVPIVWSPRRNVRWKQTLPGWGTSTPAIWDQAVFVTSHHDDGRLLLTRLDKQSGEIVWMRQVGEAHAPREAPPRQRQKFHRLHNLASPSPVTDGQRVVAHFGNGELAAYDFDGRLLWQRNLQDDYGQYTIWWGHANSPVLHQGLVISACLQDSLADVQAAAVESYLVAHDLRDGHVKWKTPRMTGAAAEEGDAYTTPLLVAGDDQTQLIVMGGNQLDAYDPLSGKQLWFLPQLIGGRTVPSPTASDGLVYAVEGMRGDLLAVKPGGAGRLGRRAVAWKQAQGTPDSCCPVVYQRLLFTVTDDGVARCYTADSGHLKWKQRLKGSYKASPLAANGRIYFLNTDGLCTVVSASTHYDKLIENELQDGCIASPAVSDGLLFIRGREALYCIGDLPAE